MTINRGTLLLKDLDPALLGKPITMTFRDADGAAVERTVRFTAEGFIDTALLEERVVSCTPGVPPVIDTTEVGYFFEGRKVRQDVQVQVDPALIGAADGKLV